MHTIEIDDTIWNHLKKFAEPFEDTPNSVLHKLLLGDDAAARPEDAIPPTPFDIKGVPKALAQIFEVLYEVDMNGCSRIEATHRVAEKRGTAPQTVLDKYCRQLNKRAHEIDRLFEEPGYRHFKELLKEKFDPYRDVIDIYFDTLTQGKSSESTEPQLMASELIQSAD
jgi:hypothetical protein